jgi:hypothetical protein
MLRRAAGMMLLFGLAAPPALAADVKLDPAAIAKLPVVSETLAFKTAHGGRTDSFTGPALWDVLVASDAVTPKHPKSVIDGYVTITGTDGFAAVIALGEISPMFEGKEVLLATVEDGKTLGAGHWRLAVPGDKFGGRYVHDIASIVVHAG